MTDENKTLGIALTDSIASEHLQELGADIADIAVDSLVQNQIIADIPIVGTVYKAGKSILAIRDAIFLKKVLIYLREHQNISLSERIRFLSQFESESDKLRFGEAMLMLLDSMNHLEKAQMLGKLSRALFLGKLSKSDFFILSDCIDRIFISDYSILKLIAKSDIIVSASSENAEQNFVAERLVSAGLLSTGGHVIAGRKSFGFEKKLNKFGKLLVNIIEEY